MELDNENYDGIIETVDEDGNVVKFELLDIVECEGNEYALLYPIGEEAEDEEEDEVVLMRLKKIGEEYEFESIESDEEFEKVRAYIDSMDEET